MRISRRPGAPPWYFWLSSPAPKLASASPKPSASAAPAACTGQCNAGQCNAGQRNAGHHCHCHCTRACACARQRQPRRWPSCRAKPPTTSNLLWSPSPARTTPSVSTSCSARRSAQVAVRRPRRQGKDQQDYLGGAGRDYRSRLRAQPQRVVIGAVGRVRQSLRAVRLRRARPRASRQVRSCATTPCKARASIPGVRSPWASGKPPSTARPHGRQLIERRSPALTGCASALGERLVSHSANVRHRAVHVRVRDIGRLQHELAPALEHRPDAE